MIHQEAATKFHRERVILACQARLRSFEHRLARRVLGEDRMLALASPWVEAALGLAPGHTVQGTYERLAV